MNSLREISPSRLNCTGAVDTGKIGKMKGVSVKALFGKI